MVKSQVNLTKLTLWYIERSEVTSYSVSAVVADQCKVEQFYIFNFDKQLNISNPVIFN